MEKVTLEETHALLEKLAEYVMTQVPTQAEMNERFEQVDKRFEQIEGQLTAMHKQMDIMQAEQAVFTKTFELHNKRLSLLEEDDSGYRVRDKKEKKK